MAIYGRSFLTKPRFFTDNVDKVNESIFQYGTTINSAFHLSFLGILNGPLSYFGIVLVCDIDDKTMEIKRWYFRKRWW